MLDLNAIRQRADRLSYYIDDVEHITIKGALWTALADLRAILAEVERLERESDKTFEQFDDEWSTDLHHFLDSLGVTKSAYGYDKVRDGAFARIRTYLERLQADGAAERWVSKQDFDGVVQSRAVYERDLRAAQAEVARLQEESSQWGKESLVKLIQERDALRAQLAAEREACAKVVEEDCLCPEDEAHDNAIEAESGTNYNRRAYRLARLIRARGTP